MEEKNTKESIFLGKLEVILSQFDKLDDLFKDLDDFMNNNRDDQSHTDKKLSDLYHIIEFDDCNDDKLINIGKKIHELRSYRRDYDSTAELIRCYNTNKGKLVYSHISNRAMFRQSMKNRLKTLHEQYQIKELTEEELKELEKPVQQDDVIKRKRKTKLPDKEVFVKMFEEGMRNKDIAQMLDVDPAVVSRLKGLYGFQTRKYTKKGK